MSERSRGRDQTKSTHWSSRLGVRIGLTTPFYKKETVTETATETLKANLVEEGSSRVEPMTCTGESPSEAGALTTLLTTKTKTRIEGPGTSEPYMRPERVHKFVKRCTDTIC